MKKKFVVEKKTLTGIVKWLNETYSKKKTGQPFRINDVQHYIRRGNLPKYMGGNRIIKDNTIEGVGLYKIVEV
jgi:hypothetical protein